MAFQGQVLNFTISDQGNFSKQQVATFSGNSLTNNKAWACMQSVDVSYNGDNNDHNRGISKFIPTVQQVNGSSVTVNLEFLYADDNPSKHTMLGTASVLVMADVS